MARRGLRATARPCRAAVLQGLDAPKSDYARRAVPITKAMARRLWALRKETRAGDGEPVFPSSTGTRLDYANVYKAIVPVMRRVGIESGGLDRLRHTCGTTRARQGNSAEQPQLWLGHHDPAFTSRTYVHRGSHDLPDADDVWGNMGQPRPTEAGPQALPRKRRRNARYLCTTDSTG